MHLMHAIEYNMFQNRYSNYKEIISVTVAVQNGLNKEAFLLLQQWQPVCRNTNTEFNFPFLCTLVAIFIFLIIFSL